MADVNEDIAQTWCQQLYVKSCDILEETAELFASCPIGQSVLKQADRCLWTVEKCAEWSLPNTQVPKQNGTKDTFGDSAPLVRPLPWALFLPMLLFLRYIRACLNVCAILIGVEPVKPAGVVKFIQVRRRRVRALKFMGLRRMRQRKLNQQLAATTAPTWVKRINNVFGAVLSFKALAQNDTCESSANKDSTGENSNSTKSGQYVKRKYAEILKYDLLWDNIDDDEELMQKIDKLVEEGNGEDPDFMPVEEDSQSEDDSLSEGEDNVPTFTTGACHTNRNSITNESIEEENEESDSTVSASSEVESIQYTKMSPAKCKPNEQETDAKINYQPECNITDEFYSPQNSISVTPEPQKELVEDSDKCNAKTVLEKSPAKEVLQPGVAEVTGDFLQAERNEVVAKNESPNSHNNKHETLVANENSSNSVNNHK